MHYGQDMLCSDIRGDTNSCLIPYGHGALALSLSKLINILGAEFNSTRGEHKGTSLALCVVFLVLFFYFSTMSLAVCMQFQRIILHKICGHLNAAWLGIDS